MVSLSTGTPCRAFLHTLAQGVDRAQLQLLDRTLGSIERRRHLADVATLDKPHLNHLPLRVGQAIHQLKQAQTPLEILVFPFVRNLRRQIVRFASFALPVIGEGVRGDAKEPRDKWDAAPLELAAGC